VNFLSIHILSFINFNFSFYRDADYFHGNALTFVLKEA